MPVAYRPAMQPRRRRRRRPFGRSVYACVYACTHVHTCSCTHVCAVGRASSRLVVNFPLAHPTQLLRHHQSAVASLTLVSACMCVHSRTRTRTCARAHRRAASWWDRSAASNGSARRGVDEDCTALTCCQSSAHTRTPARLGACTARMFKLSGAHTCTCVHDNSGNENDNDDDDDDAGAHQRMPTSGSALLRRKGSMRRR